MTEVKKVEFKRVAMSSYNKQRSDLIMQGWRIVDSSLTEHQVFMLNQWILYMSGYIIFER